MAKNTEGRLLTESEHRVVMDEVVRGFANARVAIGNNGELERIRVLAPANEVFVGMFVIGSIGAGVTDSKKPPKTGSDVDCKPIIAEGYTPAIMKLLANTMIGYLAHYIHDIDQRAYPTNDSFEELRWATSDPVRYHHDRISLVCDKNNGQLIERARRAAEINRLGLSIYHLI